MSDNAQTIPFRAGRFAPERRPVTGAGALVFVIGLWQIGSTSGFISELILPSPLAVANALWYLVASGELWPHLGASLGLALISALFPVPKIALVPLFIIWFGIGEASKVATLAFGVFFRLSSTRKPAWTMSRKT